MSIKKKTGVRLAILERPGNTVKSSGREAHVGRLSQPPSSETLGAATVMLDSKRRPASTQAVSRKVEGIEPRNQVNRKDDGVRMCGSQHGRHCKGRGGVRFLGVGDHGMRDIETARQPGRPCRCFRRNNSRQ